MYFFMNMNNMFFHIFMRIFLLEIEDVWENFFLHELTYYVLPLFVSTRIFHCKLYICEQVFSFHELSADGGVFTRDRGFGFALLRSFFLGAGLGGGGG